MKSKTTKTNIKMNTIPQKTERIHSLDSLRAIMMLLGILLHSAITYGMMDYNETWTLKDPRATFFFNDYIVILIHSFRMPIFFLIAGFFSALLFYERQPLKMIKNRVSRIVYPFIVFLFILSPLIILTFNYTHLVFSGSNRALETTLSNISDFHIFLPQNTFHLWFLYYLIFITTASVLLAFALKKLPIVTNAITHTFNWIIQKPVFRVIFFSSVTCIIYLFMGTIGQGTHVSFTPNLNTFIFYLFFFLIGWVLFKSKHLLETIVHGDWICAILGLILFSTHLFLYESFDDKMHIILNSTTHWLFIFGIMGLFIRYGSKYSHKMRYISDASYWVYLFHLLLTAIIPGIIYEWPFPATIKCLIVSIITTVICFITYHFFVRSTFIGKFLNGRKYPRKIADSAIELKLQPQSNTIPIIQHIKRKLRI